ncbi:MAG: hypothetical protein Rubg2KO_18500 [Rubricoccaceae bacterium]
MRTLLLFVVLVAGASCMRGPIVVPGASDFVTPVVFEAADGVTLYGDLYLGPEGKAGPLILAFHQGGGDARGEYGTIAPRLVQLGYSVLAIDQRSGGDRLGGLNRTVEALGESAPMCDAYLDLEATLRYVIGDGFTGLRVAWGSSYSASHVVRLATEYADDLDGVLAFSPASGGPMADCHPNDRIPNVEIPLLALRPAAEMEIESAAAQLALFQDSSHQTFVSTPGTHGASMLNPDRVEGDVEATWAVVSRFLCTVLKP